MDPVTQGILGAGIACAVSNKNNVKVADANKLIGKERVQLLIEKHGKENFIEGIKEFKKKSAINGHYTSGIIFAFLCIAF